MTSLSEDQKNVEKNLTIGGLRAKSHTTFASRLEQIFSTLATRKKTGRQRKKKGIVEIISILLLILVAVAAVTIVYAYIIGFIGNIAGTTVQPFSIISIDSACISSEGKCASSTFQGNSVYVIVVRNIGSSSISISSGGEPQLYLTDESSGISYTASCNALTGIVSQGQLFTCYCPNNCTFYPSKGDVVSVKVVDPDGGTALTTTKTI
jgi:hypothetical protein